MIAQAVLRSDPCAYGQQLPAGTVDHIQPRALGGQNVSNNRTRACPMCNYRKDATPLLIFLIRRGFPVRPYPFDRYRISIKRRKKIREAFRRLDAIERASGEGGGDQEGDVKMTERAVRQHSNGWRAVVLERADGDLLVACAFNSTGERYDPAGNAFEGGTDDYDKRLTEAKEHADLTLRMASGHGDCSCPPWARTTDAG